MRRRYGGPPLTEDVVAGDWFTQFEHWFADAARSPVVREPNAMLLATATPDGRPSARTVLLKGYSERGLVFFTNYGSRKGRELAANPVACCVLPWIELERQVVVDGVAERLPREESAAYFVSRPRGAQLGAWASRQSSVIPSREPLEAAVAEVRERFGDGPVPVPEHWGGFRIVPETVEFWQGRPDRLHDRLRFRRTAEGTWVVERLAP
ncbi:MAG: pyridoxamine 5'-phosphate oxidase [Actinobacteria bacterium]|nr:pyridoxamine 5'-phosphate oxidase [Actinomycetota bacterium]MBI3688466.1 pyridoxamine 5'-phosphate oxidase [Actinomycetota bacterium]